MRTLALPLLAVLALIVGLTPAATSARAEGDRDPAARIAALEAQVASLRADADLLTARDAAITKYLVSLSQAASNLRSGTALARRAGFEAAAIPADSRIAVLRTIDQLAADLSTGIPAPSEADAALRRHAEEMRKAAADAGK